LAKSANRHEVRFEIADDMPGRGVRQGPDGEEP
jgi:hypothetical protein